MKNLASKIWYQQEPNIIEIKEKKVERKEKKKTKKGIPCPNCDN